MCKVIEHMKKRIEKFWRDSHARDYRGAYRFSNSPDKNLGVLESDHTNHPCSSGKVTE